MVQIPSTSFTPTFILHFQFPIMRIFFNFYVILKNESQLKKQAISTQQEEVIIPTPLKTNHSWYQLCPALHHIQKLWKSQHAENQ